MTTYDHFQGNLVHDPTFGIAAANAGTTSGTPSGTTPEADTSSGSLASTIAWVLVVLAFIVA